ncbi:MAG: class I SAM-dependent methyltransferase [Gemmatimonadales bacterium]
MPFPDRSFFDEVYRGRAPWDIGDAQPDLLDLIEEHPPSGTVLDLGCGTGDLAVALAVRGHRVIGIDFARAAVEEAEARASALPAEHRVRLVLEVADALRPSSYAGAVGAVVDSGFYHLFAPEEREALAGELRATLPRGGRYYMLGFAIEIPSGDAPRQVTAAEIPRVFPEEAGWIVRAARPGRFVTNGFGYIPALAVCIERA